MISTVSKEAVHVPSEVFPGLKEAAVRTTLTSNASRTPVEDKEGSVNQGEEKTGRNC